MKTMLNIGDYAIHKTTGNFGQVVAYGHEIVDSVYLATLKVEVIDSNWLPIKKEEAPGYKISLKLPSESSKVLTRV
jgi:hypothetical protein